jgi:hypothetical protein
VLDAIAARALIKGEALTPPPAAQTTLPGRTGKSEVNLRWYRHRRMARAMAARWQWRQRITKIEKHRLKLKKHRR